MYKVFINEKAIILTGDPDLELMSNKMLYFRYDDFEEINFVISMLETYEGIAGVVIQSDALEDLWSDFRAHFKEIEAAGGLVFNEEGEVLFIHRFGKWDLPKGKREANESVPDCALREVEEECGISHLNLGEPLPDTYHTYSIEGVRHLKRTYWFDMHTVKQNLTPQTEEGITAARWMSPSEIDWDAMPTYPNIRLLVDGFLQIH
ncbi:MAG: NUDIX hydrolase [Flavobacteriales bacterium]|nr:NUDIX hydrolase [Flavobacteriales bacterium]